MGMARCKEELVDGLKMIAVKYPPGNPMHLGTEKAVKA
jgi:hypothetical protein